MYTVYKVPVGDHASGSQHNGRRALEGRGQEHRPRPKDHVIAHLHKVSQSVSQQRCQLISSRYTTHLATNYVIKQYSTVQYSIQCIYLE